MPEEVAAAEVIDIFGTLAGAAGPAIVPKAFGAAGAAVGGAGVFETLKNVSTVLTPVASIVGAASGISASRAMSKLGSAPAVSPATPMPIYGGPGVTQAQQTSFMEQLRRRGRASTILTSPADYGDKLGA